MIVNRNIIFRLLNYLDLFKEYNTSILLRDSINLLCKTNKLWLYKYSVIDKINLRFKLQK